MVATDNSFLPVRSRRLRINPACPATFNLRLGPEIRNVNVTILKLLNTFTVCGFLIHPIRMSHTTLSTRISRLRTRISRRQTDLRNLTRLRTRLSATVRQQITMCSLLNADHDLSALLLSVGRRVRGDGTTVSSILQTSFSHLSRNRLTTLKLGPTRVQRIQTRFTNSPTVRHRLCASGLIRFAPGPVAPLRNNPRMLSARVGRRAIGISVSTLFPRALDVVQGVRHLRPLVVVHRIRRSVTPLPSKMSRSRIPKLAHLLAARFALSILIPTVSPTAPPPPPPPPRPTRNRTPTSNAAPPPRKNWT